MEIVYIHRSALPSKSANSVHVMKMCEAFVNNNIKTTLVIPKKDKLSDEEIFNYYGITSGFSVKKISYFYNVPKRLAIIAYTIFSIKFSLFKKEAIFYTRDPFVAMGLLLIRKKTILEMHGKLKPFSKILYSVYKRTRLMERSNLLALVVISNKLKNIYRKEFSSLQNILVLHDGVNLASFEGIDTELPLSKSEISVGYVGSMHRGKGVELILALAKRFPTIRFNIYGGEQDQIEFLQGRCRELRNVKFHGHVANRKVPEVLCKQDILLMPYQKTVLGKGVQDIAGWMSPMKMFEYMASGRIIISSDLPVVREVLNDENAYLVPCDQQNKWEETLLSILADKNSAIKRAERARKDVEQYTWKQRAYFIKKFIINKIGHEAI